MNAVCKAASNHKYIAGLFYYIGLVFLLFMLGLAAYWQLERDPAEFDFVSFEVTIDSSNKSFYIPINFCSKKINKFTVSRNYIDVNKNIIYNVPDGEYHTNQNDCFKTMLVGNTGRLEAGLYEYNIYVKYDINPIRAKQTHVAKLMVQIN